MMSGTGIDELDEGINAVSNFFSFGALGFGEEGFDINKGVSTKALKDVTGATAAEEANKQAREQFDQQKTQALAEREAAKAQSAAEQIAMSRGASAARKSTSTTTSTNSASNLGSTERDFLGL